ncbi:hypothetical protein CJ179_38855 [Rhodococcus sp. ACS1]|uniref:hypothetical protein n=1 Tax=Rhodococcus sp. ACS1 TaxID=2028570 RepID=UPI000BB0FE7D|nr:hypothetical protein [Rhodococcus sp. ACS1]PBC38559.1 hypothetical protein CJ179_38855 [Rhodococcus sp. ACS1]
MIEQTRGESLSAANVKVERILKRDIVLDNGVRFNRNTFSTSGWRIKDAFVNRDPGHWSSRTSYLTAPDNPGVAAALREGRIKKREEAVRRAGNAWERNRRDPEVVMTLVREAEALLGALRG